MRLIKKKIPRKFLVGYKKKIILKDCGQVHLNNNEQLTFLKNRSEFDVVKKNWGYYATPSVNKRLKNFNFRTFITQNFSKSIYIMIVHKEKIKEFKEYLRHDDMIVLQEIRLGFLEFRLFLIALDICLSS